MTCCGVPCSIDFAAIHENDAVGDIAGKADFVGDHDHRHAGIGEAAHHAKHFSDKFWIERRSGLVEQHQLGLDRERPRNRHPLLLSA